LGTLSCAVAEELVEHIPQFMMCKYNHSNQSSCPSGSSQFLCNSVLPLQMFYKHQQMRDAGSVGIAACGLKRFYIARLQTKCSFTPSIQFNILPFLALSFSLHVVSTLLYPLHSCPPCATLMLMQHKGSPVNHEHHQECRAQQGHQCHFIPHQSWWAQTTTCPINPRITSS
jgi:hypothetical protein